MATAGQMIDNPITGERVKWQLTSADTGGALVRAEFWVGIGGGVRFAHIHARSIERFEILAGRMAVDVGGERLVLEAGEHITLPPRVPHRWWNDGDEELHFVTEVDPPEHFEQVVETFFGLAREGRSRADGLPGLLQLAVMTREFGLETYPPVPPRPVLHALALVLAPVGRLLGRRPTYDRFSVPARVQEVPVAK